MSSEYGFRESVEAFATMGVRVIDNTPEELRDLVIEMMDHLGKLSGNRTGARIGRESCKLSRRFQSTSGRDRTCIHEQVS